jgi:type III secretion protein V
MSDDDADPRLECLAALGVPLSAELVRRVAGIADSQPWRHSPLFLDDAAVAALWQRWHPQRSQRLDTPGFAAALRRMLVDGLALGYRLDRFRDAALPDGEISERARIAAFEACIAGDDCARLRLWVSRSQFESLRRDEPHSDADRKPEQPWAEMLTMTSDGLFYELGLTMPAPEVGIDEALQPPHCRIEWNDLHLPARAGLEPGTAMVAETVARLALLRINGRATVNPANGNECALIDEADLAEAERCGLTTWTARGHLMLMVSAVIRENAAALINRPMVDLYRQSLRQFFPELLAAVDRRFDPEFVTHVLRLLLADELSIRNLSAILQSLLELRAVIVADPKHIVFAPGNGGVFVSHERRTLDQLDAADHAEQARMTMRRYISHKYTRGQNTLIVVLIDAQIEERLMRPGEPDEAAAEAIRSAAESEIGPAARPGGGNMVLLTTNAVRRKLQRLLRSVYPRVVVLSYQELSPEMNIQPISRITADFDGD